VSNSFSLTNPAWSLTQPQRQQTTSGFAAAPDKRNVNLAGVHPQLLFVANEVGNSLHGQLKRPLLITSARDSQHTPGSLHYTGGAMDLRTRDLSPEQRQAIVAQFQAKGLIAVDEGDHIHVAMPKEGYNPTPGPGMVGHVASAPGASGSTPSGPPTDLPAIAGMTSPFEGGSSDGLGGALAQAAAPADDGMTEAASSFNPAAYLRDPSIPTLSDALAAANAEQQAPATPTLDETSKLFNIKNIGTAKQLKPKAFRIT
jgi:hypothetical protein